MKPTLQAGIVHELRFAIPLAKTVPSLYPESPEFRRMPEVFATGYLVGLLEWACILAVNPHLDWPREQTLGVHIDASHCAATPPGLEVTVRAKLAKVEGRRLSFDVEASDGVELISRGTHERFIIDRARFDEKLLRKAAAASRAG
jgi:fluoroacetyl-CoA thioesterase